MTNKKFEITLEKLDSITNINELKDIIEKEKIQYTIFEGKFYRDKEQSKKLLTKIAEIANNFKQDIEFELSDIFNYTHILGISFVDNRPKVSTGYKWKQHLDITQENQLVEHEFRVIKELNDNQEIITRRSFIPVDEINYFETDSNAEKYENATEILFEQLNNHYIKEKKEQKIKGIKQ